MTALPKVHDKEDREDKENAALDHAARLAEAKRPRTPIVSDMVQYQPAPESNQPPRPATAAVVTGVVSETIVHLTVFHDGGAVEGRLNVPFAKELAPRSWSWPPKASKTQP